MARKSLLEGWTNEELILDYAQHFYDQTNKAFKHEQAILKELAKRGIIDEGKMDELYIKKAL